MFYLAKPRVLTSPVGGSKLQGTALSLSCSSSGYPQPNITWTFNNTIIDSVYNHETLAIGRTELNQTGSYQCIFENAAGSTASSIANLVVYSKQLLQLAA